MTETAEPQETTERVPRRPDWMMELPNGLHTWLRIEDDGVKVFTGKVEVGQGIRTSLAQGVAEELAVPVGAVKMVMGDTELTPFDMGTFGSMTTPYMAPVLRRAAATAREELLSIAAGRWGVPRRELAAVEGEVVHAKSARSFSYYELTEGRPLEGNIRDDIPLKAASEWSVAGRSVPRTTAMEIVTGKQEYPSDLKRPGMLYGRILRPPGPRSRLMSVDVSQAQRIPSIRVIRQGDFIGVAAQTGYLAQLAIDAIEASWETERLPGEGDIFRFLETHGREVEPERHDGPTREEIGSVRAALQDADVSLTGRYTVDYIAHAPLEPRAAVAEWRGERLTVWTGTQRPFGVRTELAMFFEMEEGDVRVIVPDTGSGYGGKHSGEAAREAARLAKAVDAPVRVAWSREEEFTWAYVRPAGVIEISSACSRDGRLAAWDVCNFNSGAQALAPLYEIPNQVLAFEPSETILRQGSYRALAATANHFARETHIDEIARKLDVDPVELRLRNLGDPRVRDVLQAAAEKFGWAAREVGDTGVGVAIGHEKGSYVATCAEVEVDMKEARIRVRRVVQAFECGAIVNPNGLKSQVEGAILQGLGGAIFERMQIQAGRVVSNAFSRYRVPRFSDLPTVEVLLINRPDLSSIGAGETPIVGIAPAVGNAIFDACGLRLRSMPLEQALGNALASQAGRS